MPEQLPPMPPQAPMPAPDASMPPLPASPPEAGMPPADASAMPTDPSFDPAAAKADLQAGAEGLKGKEAQLATNQALSDQQLNDMKGSIIKDLFDLMKKAGVDPSDVTQVGGFMDSLQAQDPDLYELFDFAFSNLIGQPQGTQPPEMMPPGMDPSMGPMGMTPSFPTDTGTPPAGAPPGMPPDAGAPPAPPTGPKDFSNLTAALGQ